MAIVVIAEMPGVTAEQAGMLRKETDLENTPAAGFILRAAGPIPGGWRVLTVWESGEAFDAFRRDRLGPALQKIGSRPIFTFWPTDSVYAPR